MSEVPTQESVSKTPVEIEEECTRSKGTDINMALGTEVKYEFHILKVLKFIEIY